MSVPPRRMASSLTSPRIAGSGQEQETAMLKPSLPLQPQRVERKEPSRGSTEGTSPLHQEGRGGFFLHRRDQGQPLRQRRSAEGSDKRQQLRTRQRRVKSRQKRHKARQIEWQQDCRFSHALDFEYIRLLICPRVRPPPACASSHAEGCGCRVCSACF